MKGKLINTDGNWEIYDIESSTVRRIPIHYEHNLWLKMFGYEHMPLCYQLNKEDDQTFLTITSCEKSYQEFPQD